VLQLFAQGQPFPFQRVQFGAGSFQLTAGVGQFGGRQRTAQALFQIGLCQRELGNTGFGLFQRTLEGPCLFGKLGSLRGISLALFLG
jgi:hypothetical protein